MTEIIETVPEEQSPSVLQKYYDKLFSKGVLMHCHVSKWGMTAQLDKEDLEIETVPDFVRLGKKNLIKPEIFNKFSQIEQRARNYLKRMSRHFPVSQCYFVGLNILDEVVDQMETYKNEFYTLFEDFCEKYEDYKEEFLTDHEDYRKVLEPFYPSLSSVRQKFSFDYTQFRISMPDQFEKISIQALISEEEQVNEIVKVQQQRYQDQVNKQISEVTSFVQDSIGDLRNGINDVCKVIINKINKGEVVSETNKNTLLREIKNFEKLNVFDDQAMANQLTLVSEMLKENRDFKESEEDRNILKTYLTNAMEVAKNTSDVSVLTGEYLRNLEI
jgi:hypothetical protein